MKRLVRVLLPAVVGLAVLAPAASACINDGSLGRSETEFKSRYNQPSPPSDGPAKTPSPYLLSVPGAALLVGAFVMTRRREPRRDESLRGASHVYRVRRMG